MKKEFNCPACKEKFVIDLDGKDVISVGPIGDQINNVLKTYHYTSCPKCGLKILVKEDMEPMNFGKEEI